MFLKYALSNLQLPKMIYTPKEQELYTYSGILCNAFNRGLKPTPLEIYGTLIWSPSPQSKQHNIRFLTNAMPGKLVQPSDPLFSQTRLHLARPFATPKATRPVQNPSGRRFPICPLRLPLQHQGQLRAGTAPARWIVRWAEPLCRPEEGGISAARHGAGKSSKLRSTEGPLECIVGTPRLDLPNLQDLK